jgi:hypothetical protein
MNGAPKAAENIVHEWNYYDKDVNIQTIGNNQLYMSNEEPRKKWWNREIFMSNGEVMENKQI